MRGVRTRSDRAWRAPRRIGRGATALIAGVALAATAGGFGGLILAASTASAAGTGATPLEANIATEVLGYTNQDRALRGYQTMKTSQYLDTMAQAWVDYESTPANPIASGSPTRFDDPGSLWVSAYIRDHPCTGSVCPYQTVPSTPKFIATSNGSSSEVGGNRTTIHASTDVLYWRSSVPHWDNIMAPGWTMAGVGVDCATGMTDILTASTSPTFVRNTAPQAKTPNTVLPNLGTACNSVTPHPTTGYRMVAGDGGVFDFGNAQFHGSMGGKALNEPVVASAATPTGNGYWEVASDGGIFSFTAPFDGSMGGKSLNAPIVGMSADPATGGYWEVASDGGIFSFDAAFHGSMGGKALNEPIVGMAATPTGGGYWEVASDGGIFSFGNAAFHGSMGGKPLNQPIVGMAATTTGNGYWEVASDGGIFSFTAAFHGSMGGKPLNKPIVGMAADPATGGYWEVASDGGIFSFTAPFYGSMGGKPLNQPITGFAVA